MTVPHQKVVLAALAVCLGVVSWVAVRRLDEIREANASTADPDHWPCQRDAEVYCSGVPHSGGRVNACLDDHAEDLSAACVQYREATEGEDDWVLACDSELHSVCSGHYRQLECLKANQAVLSSRCKGRIRNYEFAEKWRRACFEDSARLCRGLEDAKAKVCLRERQSELSTSCKIYYLSIPESNP